MANKFHTCSLRSIFRQVHAPAEIAAALKGADPNASTEELVRYALRAMVIKGEI